MTFPVKPNSYLLFVYVFVSVLSSGLFLLLPLSSFDLLLPALDFPPSPAAVQFVRIRKETLYPLQSSKTLTIDLTNVRRPCKGAEMA
eukprot:476078-Hanusia_phi.AAC.1